MISLLMALVVVGGHSPFSSEQTRAWGTVFDGPWAVRYFFLVSGFLLFVRRRRPLGDYGSLFLRRTRTLLVPYLVWCALGALCYLLPEAYWTRWMGHWTARYGAMSLGNLGGVFSQTVLHPVPYPLWYVRSLYLFVLAYPLIHFGLRRLGLGLVVGLLLYHVFLGPHLVPVGAVHIQSLAYFMVGGWFGFRGLDPERAGDALPWPLLYAAL